MSLYFEVTKGSGKGKCRICAATIKKGAFQVVAEGGFGKTAQSGRVHLNCLNKKAMLIGAKPKDVVVS